MSKSFLLLFFKKEVLPSLLLSVWLGACAGPPAPVLAGNDAATVAAAQEYLDGLRRFHARFIASGSDGGADGVLWIDRPGRLRVEYVHPGAKLLLANHGRLLLEDGRTGAVTTMPVSRTPLDILLADHIDLSGKVSVTGVQRGEGTFQIGLRKTDAPSQGTLTVQFDAQPLKLRGVVVQDSQGHSNAFSLYGLASDAALDGNLFHYRPQS